MDATLTIALWGAATGTGSVGIQAANHRRDRPQLHVEVGFTNSRTGTQQLWIRVSNGGRQPITVVEAGFLVKVSTRFVASGGSGTGEYSMHWDGGSTVLLPPGETHSFDHEVTDWPDVSVRADDPLRPYVLDSNRKRTWGKPGCYLRGLLLGGWNPQGVDPALLERPEEPLLADPVVPRWKLWRPKDQRRPTPGEYEFIPKKIRLNTKPTEPPGGP